MRPSEGGSKHQIMSLEIQKLLQKSVIEKVQVKDSPGFYSRLFVVPKPGGQWRPIID